MKNYKNQLENIKQLLKRYCQQIQQQMIYLKRNVRSGEENKWNVIDKLNISEDVYKRRKRKLIYTVHKELNKLEEGLQL